MCFAVACEAIQKSDFMLSPLKAVLQGQLQYALTPKLLSLNPKPYTLKP